MSNQSSESDVRDVFDYVLVGGGLQSGLIALALHHHRPESRVLLIERDERIGGNHTWSYHPGDVPVRCQVWLQSLPQTTWPTYEVRLGSVSHKIELQYSSIASSDLSEVVSGLFSNVHEDQREVVATAPELVASGVGSSIQRRFEGFTQPRGQLAERASSPWQLMTNTEVINVDDHGVLTRCGRFIAARQVIDCRGPISRQEVFSGCGYQKFHGFEIELDVDGPFDSPIIMESVDDQSDGFRFIYTLPFTRRRVLVEDTAFSDTPHNPRDHSLATVQKYLQRYGVEKFKIVREESGVLPMPFSHELPPASMSPLAGGYCGGWFHAATGYSFAMAVAFADSVASGPVEKVKDRVKALAEEHRWRSTYSRLLNRLLFRLVTPAYRYRIFRRFYRVLSADAVARFYAHQFTPLDAVRIVVGIPPTLLGLRPYRFIRSFLKGESS